MERERVADLRVHGPAKGRHTPQVPRLFSMTLRDNLDLGLDHDDAEIAGAAHRGPRRRYCGHARRLETKVGPLGVRLSGAGQPPPARALLRRAESLVFDDLSSALDVETERTLWARLFADQSDVTCLVVSHRRAALRAGRPDRGARRRRGGCGGSARLAVGDQRRDARHLVGRRSEQWEVELAPCSKQDGSRK